MLPIKIISRDISGQRKRRNCRCVALKHMTAFKHMMAVNFYIFLYIFLSITDSQIALRHVHFLYLTPIQTCAQLCYKFSANYVQVNAADFKKMFTLVVSFLWSFYGHIQYPSQQETKCCKSQESEIKTQDARNRQLVRCVERETNLTLWVNEL